MDNQLDLLISVYEDEVLQLQKQLDNCFSIEEDIDYIGAYHCKNALQYTQNQLSRLKWFNDPLYYKKNGLTLYIKRLEVIVANDYNPQMKDYYEESLRSEKQKLEVLNQISKPESDPVKETLLNSTLLHLIKNEVKNVQLVLRKYENLLLQFSYKAKKLTITLPYLKKHRRNNILGDYEIESLQTIGFRTDQYENKLVVKLFGKSEELLEQFNTLMLKIVFGVFKYQGFRDDSYVHFNENKEISIN